jgi:hypothetical protein
MTDLDAVLIEIYQILKKQYEILFHLETSVHALVKTLSHSAELTELYSEYLKAAQTGELLQQKTLMLEIIDAAIVSLKGQSDRKKPN